MQPSYKPTKFLRKLHSQSDWKAHQEYISVNRSIFSSPNPLNRKGIVKAVQFRDNAFSHVPIPQMPMVDMDKEVTNTTFHPEQRAVIFVEQKQFGQLLEQQYSLYMKHTMSQCHCVPPHRPFFEGEFLWLYYFLFSTNRSCQPWAESKKLSFTELLTVTV